MSRAATSQPVGAPGAHAEDRRDVDVAHAGLVEVGPDRRRVAEGDARVELDPLAQLPQFEGRFSALSVS